MRRITTIGAVGLVFSLACAGGGEAVECGEGTREVDGACVAGDGADTDEDGVPDEEQDPPEILSFTATASSLTEGQSVSFTLVATDPQGVSDIAGAQLVGPSGAAYGAFLRGSEEGTYQLALSWDQIHQAAAIEFDAEERREFEAEVYDGDGNVARGTVTVRLHCDGDGACDGECRDLQRDNENCGACSRECEASTCYAGLCTADLDECLDDLDQTCEEACGAHGAQCVDGSVSGFPYAFAGWVRERQGAACNSDANANIEIDDCGTRLSTVTPRGDDATCFCGW